MVRVGVKSHFRRTAVSSSFFLLNCVCVCVCVIDPILIYPIFFAVTFVSSWGIEFVTRIHYSLILTIGKKIDEDDFGVNVKSAVTGEDVTQTFAKVIGCDVSSGTSRGRGVLDPERDLEPDSILTIEFEVVKLEDFPSRVPQLLANDNNPMVRY